MRVSSHVPASIHAAIGRIVAPALAAAALTCSMTGAVQAQTVAPADQTATTTTQSAAQTIAPADQASPNPGASPAGQTNPRPGAPNAPTPGSAQSPSGGPSQTRAVPAPRPVSHLPIIDVVATFTQPAYYGNRNAGGVSPVNNYDPLDVGGTVRIPVTRKFNLLFDRITEGTLNQPLDCIIQQTPAVPGNTAVRVCPNVSRDVVLQYHATYAFDRYVTLDVGDSFRHRIFNSGASGVSTVPFLCNNNGQSTGANCTVSSTEHHFGYAGLSYTTKPFRDLYGSAFSFALTVDRQNVDHHVAVACSAANLTGKTALPAAQLHGCPAVPNPAIVGYYDENPSQSAYYETTQGVTWILPVDVRHGTTFTLNERWGALNFYENPGLFPGFGTTIGQPYRWASALTYQLNKRFSPGFTLALRHSDFHSLATQGTPFVQPNAIHVGSWDVIGTFHIDTNSWFPH